MCMNHQLVNFDNQKADAFADRLVETLNAGGLSVMLSIGHRTGLFDVMDGKGDLTSEQLAEQAGLNERYVREWLNSMVVSQVADYDPDTRRYTLPDEHAAYLTRRSDDGNIAVFAQYIPIMGTVEDDIVECFQHGGGVPYDKFHRFHEIMAEDSGQTVLPALREHILPLVPDLVNKLEQGIRVLDVGCGRGKALHLLAGWFPNSTFVGMDLSQEAIEYAREEAREQGHTNVEFQVRDLSDFDRDAPRGQYDLITTFDAVHDQARPLSVLKGIYHALKDDGVYLMQDIHGHSEVHENLEHPIGPLLYALSTNHCMTVSLAQGGEGLGTLWGQEKARELLSAAGFKQIAIHQLEHDFQNDYYVIRK